MHPKSSRFKKLAERSIKLGLVFFLGLHLAMPLVAKAQNNLPNPGAGAGTPAMVMSNLYEEIQKQINVIPYTLTMGGVIGLMNAFQVFTQRIAKDAAMRILTGDAGQYPMFWEKDYDRYMLDVMENVGNQFISSLNSEAFNALGFDICQPINPLNLQLSLSGIHPPDELPVTCTLAQVGKAWEDTKASFSNIKEVTDVIAPLYSPEGNDLNVTYTINNAYINQKSHALTSSVYSRFETGGLKQVKDVISGNITTPSQEIKKTLDAYNLPAMAKEGADLNYGAIMSVAFEVGFAQLGVLTASTFISTLASGLLDKLFKGLTSSNSDVAALNLDLANPEAAGNANVASARIVLSDLLTPNLISSDQRDFVVELAGCPTPRGIWNCAMDDAFATALRTSGETGAYTVGHAALVSLNGEPPANAAYLHKDWELIPESDVKNNTDPSCYQRAYCASNLAKLRYARILPVGWEMAANSPYNTKKNGKYVTLEEVIRGFNVCNDNGDADDAHPWCKLIDPNWVLTAPPFQCRVKGYGDTVFSGASLRLEDCADAISCLKRDDRGKCTGGYGYCLAEKPVWRFTADECSEKFASCRTYQNSANERVSYLRNTLDYGSCNEDNVGCMWYSTLRDPADKEGATWIGKAADKTGPRAYFDGTVKTCSSGSDGCTKLLETEQNKSSLNLIPNSSFELASAPEKKDIRNWTYSDKTPQPDYELPTVDEGQAVAEGSRSFKPFMQASKGFVSDLIELAPLRTYTFSVYVRNVTSSSDGVLDLSLNLYKGKDTSAPVKEGPYYRSEGCTSPLNARPGFEQLISSDNGSDWLRLQCTFVSNDETGSGKITIYGSNILVDALQLEEAEFAAPFVDGANTQLSSVYLKVAPEEFACTGDSSDPPACKKYARVCRQIDTGCQGYKDVNNPSAPEIPATLSAADMCPATCVGYAEYRKQPSTFDLGKNVDPRLNDSEDDTIAHFIPAYAQSCTIQDAGCEEFTNVESAAEGGEQKAAFNYIRACEKPNENTETFFTWEGSDTTGYQLKTWSLIHDLSLTPMPPKIIEKMGPEGILKNPKSCNASSWQSGVDSDCRQFFNADGVAFYAYFSQTVISSPQCANFRLDNTHSDDCTKTGGSFNPQTGECLYKILPSQSRSCNAVSGGCRAYMGTAGRNASSIFEEDFRAGTSTLFTAGDLSNESVLVGDKSLKLTGNTPLATATEFPSYPNQLYSVSFWAKTTAPTSEEGIVKVDGEIVGIFPMEVDWRRYEFGPFSGSFTASTSTIEWLGLPNPTFIDQIRIERLNDVFFAVKDSWVTPAECDRTPEGLPQPQAMLGCRSYQDRNKQSMTVRSFGHLCREEVIGCKALIDTRNSSDPYKQTFEIKGTDQNLKTTKEAQAWEDLYLGTLTTTRSADRFIYLIDEPSARCSADAASCRAFGKPKFTQDRLSLATPTSSAFETVYLIDDVGQYLTAEGEPNMLCRRDELFCDKFMSGKTTAYFRNPGNHTCEWRDKVMLKKNEDAGIPADGQYSGWFMKGQNQPCYPKVLSSGNTYLIQNSGDPGFTGWAGMCPIEQSECTEFRDTNDHSDPVHPSGKPYFFIHNQRLDLSSCGGKVDLLSGCILLRDLSDTRLRYSAQATYNKSHAEADLPQAPVDCVSDPDNPFCRKCTDLKYVFDDFDSGSVGFKICSEVDFPPSVIPAPFNANTPKITLCQFAMWFPCEVKNPDSIQCYLQNQYPDFAAAKKKFEEKICVSDESCSLSSGNIKTSGKCIKAAMENDTNVVVKVKLDRDCSQWLGCSTAETVYDPAQQKYVDLCTETAVCDQTKGSNADQFCANYVNRGKDPILKPGAFFNSSLYTSRKTGFGELDYSGYSIPNQFQAADVQNRQVGLELFEKNPAIGNKFANDYRLTAAINEKTGLIEFPKDELTPVDKLYPGLMLCMHRQTGRTGFFKTGGAKGNRTCYFPVDALAERSTDALQTVNPELQKQQQTTDPRSLQNLSDIFRQSKSPKDDLTLMKAFPPAECKAYPEANAPFPNLYVKEWDYSKEPFAKKETVTGYGSVNLCEWGEDCACTYRKVKYGGFITKYYSPFGQAPPSGICSGGDKDGEKCIPGVVATTGAGGEQQAQAAIEDPGCPRGRCIEISDVILVRGQYGQCLQRDYSRSVANDPGRHPCLIWNPNPILASYYDTSHYIPTAGYQPPVNAGEYYCLSPANPPFESNWSMQSKTYWDDSTQPGNNTSEKEGDGDNRFFYLPGSLSKFNYDTGYIAGQCHNANTCGPMEGDCTCHDGSSNQIAGDRDFDDVIRAALEGGTAKQDIKAKGGTVESCEEDPTHAGCEEIWRFTNLGRGIDGTKPYEKGYESSQAYRCMVAHTGEDATGPPGNGGGIKDGIGAWDKSPDAYYDYGRFIQTGRGIGNTYMEYFIPVKPQGVAKWLYPDTTDADLKKLQYNALKERNFSQFQFFPLSDNTSIACALPSYYVDGVSVQDWTNSSQVSAASKTAVSNFNRDFDGTLDRSKEDILTDDKGVPIKLPCSGYNDPQEIAKMTWSGEPESGCYYKYWETNYRLADGAKFDWLTIDNHTSFFDRHAIFRSKERNCSKSGFAIRAMFENTEKSQNDLTSNEVTKGKLSGPWNFVGFWITACTVGTNDEAFLYLGLKVKHADICRQLAQVISPYTRESAAFADRVWNKGSFVVPILGYSFVTNNPPFGSALAEGLPGVEPLFQTGLPVEIPSKLKPPTFLGSGVSYSSSRPSPLQNWANLTNIFARVYRVYTYYDAGVPIDGFACIGGVNDGAACPTPRYENDKEWIAKADEVCGGIGSCNDSLVSIQVKNTLGRCNSLSGVNRGLSCGGNFDRVTKDPICHNFAMKDVDGVLVAQKTKCELRSTWQDCGKGYYLPPGKTSCKNESLVTKTAHETRNAFGCGKDAVLPGAGCAEISDYSTDCPLRIDAGDLDCISDPDSGINVGHCSGGYGHANCIQDSDCVFTASQWWGAYDNQTYSAGGNLVATYYPPTGNDKTIQKNVALPFQYSPGKGEELYPSDADPRMDTVDVLYGDKYWGTGNVAKISRFAFPQTKQDQTPTDNWLFQHVSHLRYGAFARLPGYIPIIPLWPAPSTVATTFNAVVPGLCEGPVGASLRPQGGNQFYSDGIYGGRSIYAFHAGLCEGGVREGQSCSNLSDVPGYLPGTGWPHPNTCAPPKDMPKGECKLVTSISKEFDPVNGQTPILECSVLGMGDPFSDDPDLDNNACTRSAGYKPRKDLCGKNLDSEKCLVGYDLGNTKNKTYTETFTDVSLDQTQSLAPTDVTSGFHNPIFLGLNDANPYDYQHIAYYAPRPPTIAAPDLSRTCESPGQCRISKINGFTLESRSEGSLMYGGGKAQVSMSFYGWAAQEQTPLKDLYIDWGDGTLTKIENARMKNKKPFCGGTRECELVDGLTCNTDADCPPAAGKCVDVGTCGQSPTVRCVRDQDCALGGNKNDKCMVREFFGNSEDACEANYFQFSHAYACDPLKLKPCEKYCTGNPDLKCDIDWDCGLGDKCVGYLAPSVGGGCYDAQKVACRYTPKVMLKDSWNWCTGECRAGSIVGDTLFDAANTKVRHIYGGCWDGTETVRNTEVNNVNPGMVMEKYKNECRMTAITKDDANKDEIFKNIRPWIVYPGSVQIGTLK